MTLAAHGKNYKWLVNVALPFEGDECLPWPFDRSFKGYGRVRVSNRRHAAHRIVCEHVHGSAPLPDMDAAHSCGNGHLGCVNPGHIRWKSRQENILEKNDHGTMARGERNGNAVISEAVARKAKALIGRMSQREIGAELGITRSAVRDIKLGRTWAWL